MPSRLYHINDPAFCEFVFHCMRTATRDQKSKLNIHEIKEFRDEKAMRRFALKEPVDKRILMLSKLGIDTIILSYAKDADNTELMNEIVGQGKCAKTRVQLSQKMRENKVFAWGSRDVMFAAHMATMNSHSQIFVLDHEYRKQTQRLSDMDMDQTEMQIGEMQAGFDLLSKILLMNMATQDSTEAICGVTYAEMQVLLAILPFRNTFVSRETIADRMSGEYRGKGLAKVAGNLEKKGYLVKQDGAKDRRTVNSYSILAKGIDAAATYMKYILKHSR